MHLNASTSSTQRKTNKTASGHAIERGIPIPALPPIHLRGAGGGRSVVLDLSGLGVGDSVFIPAKSAVALRRMRVNTLNAAKRADIKTTSRSVDGGLRVWRTA